MVAQGEGKARPSFDLRHYSPKMKRPHLISQLLYLLGIVGGAKALGECEKGFFLFLLRFQSLFHQFDQHAIVAETPFLRDSIDLLRQPGGQGDASPNLLAGCHCTIVHRYGALACAYGASSFALNGRGRPCKG